MNQRYYNTAAEVASILGFHVNTIHRWARAGIIPYIGHGRARRFILKDVEKALYYGILTEKKGEIVRSNLDIRTQETVVQTTGISENQNGSESSNKQASGRIRSGAPQALDLAHSIRDAL